MGQNRHTTELFEGAGIVGMGRAVEDQSQHRQLTTVESLQAQQCVVQGAESAAGHQDDRSIPALQLIDLQPSPR